jgi:dolichyl-phosphate-mannose--protein O-mannosyl transferase
VALLVLLGVGMARRGGWRRVAGVLAAMCALAAGVFDVFENFAILDILDMKIAETSEAMLAAIRGPSTAKWSLAAVSAALLVSHYESFVRSAVSRSLRSGEGGARRTGD